MNKAGKKLFSILSIKSKYKLISVVDSLLAQALIPSHNSLESSATSGIGKRTLLFMN